MHACNMYFYIQKHFLLKHYIIKKKKTFLFWEPAELLLKPTFWNQQFQQDGNLLLKYDGTLFIKSKPEGSKMQ